MALLHLPLPSTFKFHSPLANGARGPSSNYRPSSIRIPSYFMISVGFECKKRIKGQYASENATVRRSANYHPSIWKDEFIQSLSSQFKGVTYGKRLNPLIGEVKAMLKKAPSEDSLEQLELIDTLQRLGISYHFESEIKHVLKTLYNKRDLDDNKKDLYATSLEFRLFRQHGFEISQEVFSDFKDEIEISDNISFLGDINGILSLYEASFLSFKNEDFLEKAKCFAINYLEKYMRRTRVDEVDMAMIKHALELPLHWRTSRMEARWFIDIYERKKDMNPILLEMAKLDFNMLQSIYQEDLKSASSWWTSSRLGEKLSFSRDRLMANFLWTIGTGFEPEFSYSRRMITKINSFITILDDIYDVYGTLDELDLFTNAIERWDVNAIDEIPYYMKVCFLALHDSINEMAFQVFKDQEVDVIQYLHNVWIGLCKSYLQEAKWYHSNYKPTLEEYMDNAWVSISGPVILVHSYVFATSHIAKEELESLDKTNDIIRWSSTILRLADDLATSSDELKRGDVPKSIQCYMNDTGVSENDARNYIKHLINETWKKLNESEAENIALSQVIIQMSKNLARMAQCMYLNGDGYGIEQETKDHVLSLIIHPIPI
ncbi:terpene synthase 10-like isoform X1 [Cucumis melo]|uniref:Terpene synthase 10-like isoform X1 n=1 Tax=Cucumis melo TaxID=3656 RepID=A0A1S3CES4_CUCME|nr:terpene synthase 10-like isoform X1 [Cucumis melo]